MVLLALDSLALLTFHVPCFRGSEGNLAGACRGPYSAAMNWIRWLLFAIILAFFAVVYAGLRSWRRMGAGKRIAGILLLAPHFLVIVCIVVSLLCGHPPQGSECFNRQFVCAVLVVFILPLPALAGTVAALAIFIHARTAS